MAISRGDLCQVFMSDMNVRLLITSEDVFYYPDLLVSCDPLDRARTGGRYLGTDRFPSSGGKYGFPRPTQRPPSADKWARPR